MRWTVTIIPFSKNHRARLAATVAGLGALAAVAAASQGVAQGVAGPALFVSPQGSDANSGLSPDQPFQTLERARDAMRASPIKTVYLEGGVYARSAPLSLSAADAGETWLGFPGQTPILDGGGAVKRGITLTGPHITVRWLTVQNYAESGIFAQNVTGVVIDSNTVKNTQSTAWNQAGIVSIGNFTNSRITHNLVENSQYDGILSATSEKDSITNLLIQDNAVFDSCTRVADCGAIHANDRGHASTNIRIDHNVVGRYGQDALQSKGIYLDDLLSNTAVTNNIVYGHGQYAVQVHGGDHNTVQNNIFDVRQAKGAVLYQTRSADHRMEANVFRCNIVYSAPAAPGALWRNLGGGVAAAEDRNLYWSAQDGQAPQGSTRHRYRHHRSRFNAMSGPTAGDADFADADAGDYRLRSGKAADFCGFQPVTAQGAGPLPNP
jgi:parallel beta-helix repeat protein